MKTDNRTLVELASCCYMLISAKCGAEDRVRDGKPGLSHRSAGWNRNVVSWRKVRTNYVQEDHVPMVKKCWKLVEKVLRR